MTQQNEVRTGTLAAWMEKRNFAYITPDTAGDPEVFVHLSDIVGGVPLPRNSRVQYELVMFGGKTKAARVQPLATGGALSAPASSGERYDR